MTVADAHSGNDHPKRQGQLDAPQQLSVRHAHPPSCFNDRGVHAFDARVRVANQW